MNTCVAVMSIIVDNGDSVENLNALLHEYADSIIGRMGIPYRKRGINIISIALDAPRGTIAELAEKISALPGLSAETAYSCVADCE